MSSHQPSHREVQSNGHGEIAFSAAQEAEIVTIIAKYPTMKSAVMPLLWIAQRQWGWISHDVCRIVAKRLELPPSTPMLGHPSENRSPRNPRRDK